MYLSGIVGSWDTDALTVTAFFTAKHSRYYRNEGYEDDENVTYTLTFTLNFPHDNDTVYIAHCYPYTYRWVENQAYYHHVTHSSFSTVICKKTSQRSRRTRKDRNTAASASYAERWRGTTSTCSPSLPLILR